MYDPASRDGQATLAHELTHVGQQTGFTPAAQREGADEEELQMSAVQREGPDEEELQMSAVQREGADEEELQMSAVQRERRERRCRSSADRGALAPALRLAPTLPRRRRYAGGVCDAPAAPVAGVARLTGG